MVSSCAGRLVEEVACQSAGPDGPQAISIRSWTEPSHGVDRGLPAVLNLIGWDVLIPQQEGFLGATAESDLRQRCEFRSGHSCGPSRRGMHRYRARAEVDINHSALV